MAQESEAEGKDVKEKKKKEGGKDIVALYTTSSTMGCLGDDGGGAGTEKAGEHDTHKSVVI